MASQDDSVCGDGASRVAAKPVVSRAILATIVSWCPLSGWMRSSTSSRRPVAAVRTASTRGTTRATRAGIKSPRSPRSPRILPSIAVIGGTVRPAGHARWRPCPTSAAGQFGPQLAALIAYLTVVCRLPRLVVQRLLADVLQIPLSLGSTQHAWEEASAAVAAPYKALRQALANQPVLNADETGHRTNGATRWLWTLVAPTFVFYTIATSRGADVLRHLLGTAFAGVLGSDRLSTYLTYPAAHRQFCWAHFRRNLLSAQDLATTAAARRFCREALTLPRQLSALWPR